MTYWPWTRPPRRQPEPPPRVPPVVAGMAAEFADRPFGGFAGEMLQPARERPQAPPQPVQGFVIEPPPWHGREAELLTTLPRPQTDEPRPTIGDYNPAEFVLAAPPLEPLLPPAIPPPDWRQEELDRARAEEHALAEEQPRRHPPARRETP